VAEADDLKAVRFALDGIQPGDLVTVTDVDHFGTLNDW